MLKFWTFAHNHRCFRQFAVCTSLLLTTVVQGQVSSDMPRLESPVNRRPASYIPDDDVIVKPMDNEISFYQRYVGSDASKDVVRSRNQLKVWNDNQQFAEQYGMDSSLAGSPFYVPTQEEKTEYFKSKYMRYLQRKGSKPFQDMPKNWYNDYRASNEVDTIDEMEARFKSTNKKTSSGNLLPDSLKAKEISVWKKTKFIFQPRVEQGLMIVGFNSPIAYARAWVGVNGKTEINVQQSYDKTGTRFMVNYYADTGKYFTSVDQRLYESLYARATRNIDPTTKLNDNTFMLLYATQF